jgi:hypothetical protein
LIGRDYHACGLGLEIFDFEIRFENVFGELVLQLALYFLSESQMDLGIVWVEFGENH